jgi:hypothetical protein
MFPELEMDCLVEVTGDRYYGPTTLGAVREFIRLGEINAETFVINSCDGSRRQIKKFPDLLPLPNEQGNVWSREEGAADDAPAASTMAINLRGRSRVCPKNGGRCGNSKNATASWKRASTSCCKNNRRPAARRLCSPESQRSLGRRKFRCRFDVADCFQKTLLTKTSVFSA